LEIGAPPGAHSLPGAEQPHFTHLFVTLAGVDVHPSALAEDDSAGWHSLATELQEHPRQVDLLADANNTNSSAQFSDAVLPAGFYGQVRLLFAGSSESRKILDTNACGERALHCAVTSEGRFLPMTFATASFTFRVPSGSLDDRRFYVPPDGTVILTIALDRDRSFLVPLGHSFTFAPKFRMSVLQRAALSEE